MYHVELREFPHNTHAFNLDAARLYATVLDPFLRGVTFKHSGYEWVPQRTKLTILEGDELPLHDLGIGRGWANALRSAKDVTNEILSAAQAASRTARPGANSALGDREDAVVRDILARTAIGPLSLATIWDRAEIAAPDASSGEWLVLAQHAVTKVLADGRLTLRRGEAPDAPAIPAENTDAVLRTREAWGSERATALFVHTV